MRTFASTLALATAAASGAHAAGMFGPADPTSTASLALTIFGLAIIGLTAVSSIGALVAGVVVTIRGPNGARGRGR